MKNWLKNWPEGVPISIKYPKIPLFEFLRNTARKFPNRTAMIFYGKKTTYKQLDVLTDRFAAALSDIGVKKGDIVALLLPNIPQFVISYYGALKAGAAVTTISPLQEEGEVGYELRDSGAETIVALDLLFARIEHIQEETKLKNVIVTSVTDYLPLLPKFLAPLRGLKTKSEPGAYRFQDLIKRCKSNPPEVEINPEEDVAVLQYTGGTTGTPKGVTLTHYNLVVNAIQIYHWTRGWGHGEKPQKTILPCILCLIPFFHIYGMTVAMNEGILSGSTLILIPRLELEPLLKAIAKYDFVHFPGIPMMYTALLDHPKVRRHDFTSLHHCISGAAPLPTQVTKRFEELTGANLIQGYGLTEASPVTHCNPTDKEKRKPGSIGIPFPDTDAKIVDAETGEIELPPGEEGELVVRGPQVMKGYWNRPEETKRALRGGWLFTGDIAKMDEDGHFYIVDRKSDMIIASGHRMWPSEVEEVLHAHPSVKEAAVIGVADPYRCVTSVKAFVALREGYEGRVSKEDLMRFCDEKLPSYAVPSFIEFRNELPKTTVGRVFRRMLREGAS